MLYLSHYFLTNELMNHVQAPQQSFHIPDKA